MSQDAQIREQIEAAQAEIKRIKAGGKVSLGGHQEVDNTEAQIKSLEAMIAEQQTRLKRLKQQSNQD
jgi:predicted RNase H-like nuclease (RuvC/YqgF family)